MGGHARELLGSRAHRPRADCAASTGTCERDITVPMGISRTVAISLYFISSTSHSSMTSSKGAEAVPWHCQERHDLTGRIRSTSGVSRSMAPSG